MNALRKEAFDSTKVKINELDGFEKAAEPLKYYKDILSLYASLLLEWEKILEDVRTLKMKGISLASTIFPASNSQQIRHDSHQAQKNHE